MKKLSINDPRIKDCFYHHPGDALLAAGRVLDLGKVREKFGDATAEAVLREGRAEAARQHEAALRGPYRPIRRFATHAGPRPRAARRRTAAAAPVKRTRRPSCHGKTSDPDGPPPAHSRIRLQYLARRLHALGPKPLFHFLAELESGAPLRPHLEEYATLPRDLINAYGGDQFAPDVFLSREVDQ
jgi:hypothetical protein